MYNVQELRRFGGSDVAVAFLQGVLAIGPEASTQYMSICCVASGATAWVGKEATKLEG
jgi:hypothetical protein